MPLAISPDGKGWVRVPPPRRRKVTTADRNEAFKSPLAYFACTPVPAPKPRIPDIPVYHLDPNEHTPPGSPTGPHRSRHGGHRKGRSASSPQHGGRHRHPYDDEFNEEEEYHTTASSHRRPTTPPRSTISHERTRPRHTHTPGAVAAAVAASSRSSGPSQAPKQRAATTAAPSASGAGYTYWTGPSNKARVPPRSAAWGSGGAGGAAAGGGTSARWANATAPLAL